MTVVGGMGDAGSKPRRTVIGAGRVSCGVGAGGLANMNIDVTLINSDTASLLMSVISDLLSRVGNQPKQIVALLSVIPRIRLEMPVLWPQGRALS